MASFVMHYVASENFLNDIYNKYRLTIRDRNNFRLGNLVVDTMGIANYDRDTKLDKKLITHFRDDEDRDKCMQLPNINKFMDKYENLVNIDYSAMGYLFHLYTDKIFFNYLYNKVIECCDINKEKTNNISDNYYIRVKKTNDLYKTNDFYSGSDVGGLYKDYSRINRYLMDKYNVIFDYDILKDFSLMYFNNPGISEVNYEDIGEVIDKINIIINSSSINREDLKIFDINDIYKFISVVVDGFNYEFSNNIKKLVKKK